MAGNEPVGVRHLLLLRKSMRYDDRARVEVCERVRIRCDLTTFLTVYSSREGSERPFLGSGSPPAVH